MAEVVRVTLNETPGGHLDALDDQDAGGRFGIGKDTVAKIWRDHELKPWKVDTLQGVERPAFEEKLVDVVGLYLDPPAKAVVFSFRRENAVSGVGSDPAEPADACGVGPGP